MKKTLLLIGMIAFTFALNVNLYTCAAAIGQDGKVTFSLCADSDSEIAGIQFDFDGGTSGFEIEAASGGTAEAAGFTMSASATRVLGFSFSGSTIPAMDGEILINITGPFTNSDETTIGPILQDIAFASPTAGSGVVTVESSQWDGAGTLDADSILPSVYSLKEAYPNPFNPSTTIDYTLKESSDVSIVVYDLTGREVKTLVNEFKLSNGGETHSVVWNGTDNAGQTVSSGIYIYRMVSNDFAKSHRITLMK